MCYQPLHQRNSELQFADINNHKDTATPFLLLLLLFYKEIQENESSFSH